MPNLADLKIKIFADTAALSDIRALRGNHLIKGFTTNPSLARQAKVRDYLEWAWNAAQAAAGLPISFEVIADEFADMERQAKMLAGLGDNVYVKIPITNTRGESSFSLIDRLHKSGVKVNVTAITTADQVWGVRDAVAYMEGRSVPSILSIFAGRVADTGVNPLSEIEQVDLCGACYPDVQLLWASTREVLNIFQAAAAGCHIITVTPDILKKLPLIGKDLTEYSLDTVKQFYRDAKAAEYSL